MIAAHLLKYTSKNGSLSKALFEKARITRGVLQGSVLGPVLFFLLANHLPSVLHEHYAKPLCMLIITLANKSAEILLGQANATVDKAKQCCTDNQLALNKSETD